MSTVLGQTNYKIEAMDLSLSLALILSLSLSLYGALSVFPFAPQIIISLLD